MTNLSDSFVLLESVRRAKVEGGRPSPCTRGNGAPALSASQWPRDGSGPPETGDKL